VIALRLSISYAFAKIDALTSEGEAANIINLKFKVSPHKKVYINRITITGNTRTQDEVIALRLSIIFLRSKILPVLSVRSFDKLSLDSFNILPVNSILPTTILKLHLMQALKH
jgi:hypothetical protein